MRWQTSRRSDNVEEGQGGGIPRMPVLGGGALLVVLLLSWLLGGDPLALLQQLETELGSLYELHQTLLESTQDLVAIFDEQGKLLLNNQPFSAALAPANSSLTLEQLRADLRKKIEPDPAHPRFIRTIRNEGYLFVPEGD